MAPRPWVNILNTYSNNYQGSTPSRTTCILAHIGTLNLALGININSLIQKCSGNIKFLFCFLFSVTVGFTFFYCMFVLLCLIRGWSVVTRLGMCNARQLLIAILISDWRLHQNIKLHHPWFYFYIKLNWW